MGALGGLSYFRIQIQSWIFNSQSNTKSDHYHLCVHPHQINNCVKTFHALLRNILYTFLMLRIFIKFLHPIASNVWCFLQIFIFPKLFNAHVWRWPTDIVVYALDQCRPTSLINIFLHNNKMCTLIRCILYFLLLLRVNCLPQSFDGRMPSFLSLSHYWISVLWWVYDATVAVMLKMFFLLSVWSCANTYSVMSYG